MILSAQINYVLGQKRPTRCAPDAGILRQSQVVFYASAFFWLDGFAVPAQVVEPVETQRR